MSPSRRGIQLQVMQPHACGEFSTKMAGASAACCGLTAPPHPWQLSASLATCLSAAVLLLLGSWVVSSDNLCTSLPPLLHYCNKLQSPTPHTSAGITGTWNLFPPSHPNPPALPSFTGEQETYWPPRLAPSQACTSRGLTPLPPQVKGGHRHSSVLAEPPPRGCEMRLLFSRQHPLTALPKWPVPISCWRLFNHLTRFFNFYRSCPYISIPANGLPWELSSPKFWWMAFLSWNDP